VKAIKSVERHYIFSVIFDYFVHAADIQLETKLRQKAVCI